MIIRLIKTILLYSFFASSAFADSEWMFIGKDNRDASIYATKAVSMSDGSWRAFIKSEKVLERKPEGVFSMFKKPEKYTETGTFPILISCRRGMLRNYVAGPLGSEFHEPWILAAPGTAGALAVKAFCKK